MQLSSNYNHNVIAAANRKDKGWYCDELSRDG